MRKANFLTTLAMGFALTCLCAATAVSAPRFDIDFYGGDSGLVQGIYDTGSNLELLNGQSVSADILISGLAPGNGLIGWSFLMEHGNNLVASNIRVNAADWPIKPRQPNIQPGFFTVDAFADFGASVSGDDLLLFSFNFTVVDSTMASVLTLWDYDKGDVSDDVMTIQRYVLDGNHLPATLASVNTASSVPLPGSIFFLLISLTGLFVLKKK